MHLPIDEQPSHEAATESVGTPGPTAVVASDVEGRPGVVGKSGPTIGSLASHIATVAG